MRAFLRNLHFLAAFVVFGQFVLAGVAAAATYDVTASVDFPAPTQPAVITGSIDGTTTDTATLVVNGTCEVLVPNGVVSIWRDGIVIGSAPCTGTFSVTVALQEGANELVARSASVSSQYGPDSTPVTVTLVLPVPAPAPTPAPSSPGATDDVSQNAGAASELSATPAQAFSTISSDNAVVLMVVVAGGSTPYTIYINWGDGTEETRTVDQPGTYQFSHTYTKDGSYVVNGVVRDVLGATTSFNYAVVSQKPAPQPVTSAKDKVVSSQAQTEFWWPWLYISLGLLVAILGYRLGVIRSRRETLAAPTRKKQPVVKKKRS